MDNRAAIQRLQEALGIEEENDLLELVDMVLLELNGERIKVEELEEELYREKHGSLKDIMIGLGN